MSMSRVRTTRLFDRHTHVSLYAALVGCPDLSGLDREGALRLLRALPFGRVTTVLGWRFGGQVFGGEELRRLPPVVLVNSSLHGLTLTPAARERLHPVHAEIVERHEDATWSERNLPRLLSFYASSAGLSSDKLTAFMRSLEARGVGMAEDLLLSGSEAWQVMAVSPSAKNLRVWATPDLYEELPAEAQVAVAGLKLFLDGALGARTAALSEPYRTPARGLLLYSDGGLREALRSARSTGKPLALHAIGDLAITQALDALAELLREGSGIGSIRLEHVQFITEGQARRARDLGLILSMQPNFNAESVLYADRLGPRALEANNPFRMLIDRVGFRPGVDLIFGSDGMPHGLEYAAQWGLFPSERPQRLTLEEILLGYGATLDERGPVVLEVNASERRVRLVQG
jgi:predicted amidohydrolase YtcJ